MSLTKEQYEELPEFVRDEYVETEEGYKHGGFLKVKQTANDLNAKLEQERKEREGLSERLSTFEQSQAEAIEKARQEALEEAKSKGDVDAIEQRYQEQMADLEKRTAEKTRAEVMAEIAQERATEKARSISKEISVKMAVDDESAELLDELLQKRIEVDPSTGKEIFLNDDGSASSLSRAEYIEHIKTSSRYKRLIKAEVATNGGGNANGSTGSSAKASGNDVASRLAARLNSHGIKT